jgi:hypothetical protein
MLYPMIAVMGPGQWELSIMREAPEEGMADWRSFQ